VIRRPLAFWLTVALLAAVLVGQGASLARQMVTWGDETAYLVFGHLVVTGQAHLFQDELVGHRMPLPFYVVGASQLAGGRSLLAARWLNLAIGMGALVLAAVVGRALAGPLGGVMAALLLASQGVLVGYFATATYHALTNATLLGALALILTRSDAAGRVGGMALVSLLFLMRTNLFPVIPAVLLALLILARTTRERLILLSVTLAPPAVFFSSDPRHLKVLAYVPGLAALVAPLGYRPIAGLLVRPEETTGNQLWAFILFARRFEFLMLGILILAVALVVQRWRGGDPRALVSHRPLLAVAGLAAYTFAWQLVIHRARFKEVLGYFPSFAALVPVVLGAGFALVLTRFGWSRRSRVALACCLVPVVIGPMVVVRHPLLPLPAEGVPALGRLDAAGARLETLIPAGASIFLFGYATPLYLADRLPYLRQIHDPGNISTSDDEAGIARNGLWGLREIDTWLGHDADYAVVMPRLLETFRPTRGAAIERIEALLARHFTRVATVDEYPWWVWDVYARRPRPASGSPGGAAAGHHEPMLELSGRGVRHRLGRQDAQPPALGHARVQRGRVPSEGHDVHVGDALTQEVLVPAAAVQRAGHGQQRGVERRAAQGPRAAADQTQGPVVERVGGHGVDEQPSANEVGGELGEQRLRLHRDGMQHGLRDHHVEGAAGEPQVVGDRELDAAGGRVAGDRLPGGRDAGS
jgi:hypothetical protein